MQKPSFQPMHTPHSPALQPTAKRRGAALVIVLAFVVLLTGLIIAFFSRSVTVRQVSSSSASETKVDLFAQGALNTILGDLKQEITDTTRSTGTTVTGGTVYVPKAGCSAPALTFSGAFTAVSSTTYLQNLVKCSAYGIPFYTTTGGNSGPNRACLASSTTPSLNGRSVSLARWNKPLFVIGSGAVANSIAPTTPPNGRPFPPLNWILVARDGSTTPATALSSNMCTSATNSTTIVGRYAYMIYNEGGLLDVNVAGCPSSSANYLLSAGITTAPAANYKVNAAYADLTVLDTNNLKQPLIDQLMAWRNYASIQPTGSLSGSYTIPAASGSNYHQFLLSNTTGFLNASGAMYINQSDRRFVGRQELLDFMNNVLKVPLNSPAYQCLGTFSRDLEQPSYVPTGPGVNGRWYQSKNDYTQYTGNNDAATDVPGTATSINPSFLTVRCAGTFTRNNKTTAQIGEPLVKYRFPLQRLAWLTYLGPSANRNTGDADIQTLMQNGISSAYLQQGTPENIYKSFGLIWDNSNKWWVYNHTSVNFPGSTNPVTSGTNIFRLNAVPPQIGVASQNREPDFVELLKAAINAGCLAKGAANNTDQAGNSAGAGYIQHERDTSVDEQIIQICANIMDQYDCDGFPTHIRFSNNSATGDLDFYGIENLPYIMSINDIGVQVDTPKDKSGNPLPFSGSGIVGISGTMPQVQPLPAGQSISNGKNIYLKQPVLWNPHDINSSPGNPAPFSFRFTAETTNPPPYPAPSQPSLIKMQSTTAADNWGTPNMQTNCLSGLGSGNLTPSGAAEPGISLSPDGSPNSAAGVSNSTLVFKCGPGYGPTNFHEPTLLGQPMKPRNSSLNLGNKNTPTTFGGQSDGWYDARPGLSGTPYIGVYCGWAPAAWIDGSPAHSVQLINLTNTNATPHALPSGTTWVVYANNIDPGYGPDITYRLQYTVDSGASWQTYDCKFLQQTNSGVGIGNIPDWTPPTTLPANSDVWTRSQSFYCSVMDPRTSRFTNTLGNPGDAAPLTYFSTSNFASPPTVTSYIRRYSDDNFKTNDPDNLVWAPLRTYATIYNGNNRSIGGGNTQFPGCRAGGNLTGAAQIGWNLTGFNSSETIFNLGLFQLNNPAADNFIPTNPNSPTVGSAAQYFADPDGVVRRAMGAWVPPGANAAASTDIGLPMSSGTSSTPTVQPGSRPIILNRPFRAVSEMGYTFSDTPWRNLDFSTPESGFAALLDVFCINENTRDDALVAGKIDLNTRQTPVLKAVLAKAYKDEFGTLTATGTTEAASIASALVNRTIGTGTATLKSDGSRGAGPQPLVNIADLVGKYVRSAPLSVTVSGSSAIDGSKSFDGFSYELGNLYTGGATSNAGICQRFREAAIRGLSQAGTTRTWSLMIDLVAQTGRYPSTAAGLDNFLVEGEQRYWVHVAIDRYTGQVLDMNIEPVKE